MKEIKAQDLKILKCIIIENNREFNGFKIELRTKKTSTYILLSEAELFPVIEILNEKKDITEQLYI